MQFAGLFSLLIYSEFKRRLYRVVLGIVIEKANKIYLNNESISLIFCLVFSDPSFMV